MNMDIYPADTLILAPLSGFTDLPYRRSARRHACCYAFTEMVDAGSLVYRNEKTVKMLERGDDEPWLGLQLLGADSNLLKEAVKIVNDRNFDLIDFNLGCPAPKVARKGEGAVLGENIDKAVVSFEAIAQNASVPVTCKIRILSESDPAPTVELAEKLYSAGVRAVTIHGRVRSRYYSGPVFYDIIKAVSEILPCNVIANGGVFDFRTYSELREKTGADTVMIARGAMGNPWIFEEIKSYLETGTNESYVPPTPDELADEVYCHISEMIDFYGPELGFKVARKVILDYMSGRGFPRVLKTKVIEIASLNDLKIFTDELRKGPSGRYCSWLEKNPDAARRLSVLRSIWNSGG